MAQPSGDIDSVNHVGIVAHDLAAASRLYESLGFTLSALSVHSGSTKPGEPPQPMASANRCAIFDDNYMELLGIVNPGRMDWGCERFLEQFQGAHVICFGCGDAQVVDTRLAAAGVKTSGVIALQRDVATPDGSATAKFDCVHFDRATEGLIQAAHHRTPELIHQSRYRTHANGAKALSEVVLWCAEPAATATAYAQLTGCQATGDAGKHEIQLPNGNRLIFVGTQELKALFPSSLFPPPPAIVAVGFHVAELDATERVLKAGGFRVQRTDGRLMVAADEALGVVHYFMER
ncbi:MAG: VOC family protein [Pigmentiphaga sp.]|nr:VOC family protein [Pigmentiphaga sp.]